ncbi:MAG: phosphoadenosine phosphosulfate reductase domain-containing protein, partial [Candidatus Heimdallarchaeaceae archaeon]
IIKLNSNGLYLLNNKITKNWVKIDSGAREKILQGANILVPGVIDAYSEIKKGDYIVVLDEDNEVIAGGIARIDEIERKNYDKGTYAKNYLSVKNIFIPRKQKYSWEEIVHWNLKELQRIEDKAIRFIKKTKDELKLPVMVSFSGGKDSLVTLSLVQQALENEYYKVLFVNTGIEFPETVEYVNNSSEKLDFKEKLIIENVDTNLFWEAFDKFGPPGRDFRHCCKFAKLAPIQRAIEREYKNGQCISFVGQRRYESFRRTVADTWQNQYVKNQINITPIQDWTAFSIWLYIYWKNLPYNPLYDEGYERIGCWTCPSSDMAQLNLLKESHQDLYYQLYDAVEKWRTKRTLPSSYWKYGLWRFKNLPRKITTALSLEREEFKYDSRDTKLSSLQVEASNCVSLPISVIGAFSESFNIDTIIQALPLLG